MADCARSVEITLKRGVPDLYHVQRTMANDSALEDLSYLQGYLAQATALLKAKRLSTAWHFVQQRLTKALSAGRHYRPDLGAMGLYLDLIRYELRVHECPICGLPYPGVKDPLLCACLFCGSRPDGVPVRNPEAVYVQGWDE